jgi:Serine aminopeptidase, S33
VSTQIQPDPSRILAEQAGYFEVPGAHLYTVLHRVEKPIARVLLVGPFASERHSSYIPWVLWARYLAERGIEVLRFDYRGIGESEGVFEETSFDHWCEDAHLLAGWLKNQSPDLPLVLHGLGIGALLASLVFDAGLGESLLLWSPPANANQALRSMLVRWVNVEQLFKYGDERKPPSVFIQQLERGSPIEVEGYQWSGKLWQDSFHVHLPAALQDEGTARAGYKRPVRIVKLGKEASPLVKAGTVADDRPKDFSWLFDANWEWITKSIEDSVRNIS